jgi:hypothetical protein
MDFMQIDALYFYLTNYNWYLSLNLRWLCYSFILVDLAVNPVEKKSTTRPEVHVYVCNTIWL